MDVSETQPIEFKYARLTTVDAEFDSKAGSGAFTGVRLIIGNLVIASESIRDVEVEENLFRLKFLDEKTSAILPLQVEIFATDITVLVNAINAERTRLMGQRQREQLSQNGQLADYREELCPFCQSTISLTGLPVSPQVYCEFCDTLFTVQQQSGDELERFFRLCENCGMYSRPRHFAVFYFYFLIFTFGFHHDATVRCSGCMRSSAWKMVFGNLLGLLGFPFALLQLYRAYSTKSLTGRFEGLDSANMLSRRGYVDNALNRYDELMDRVPENAGIKFNIGFGLMVKRDFASAEQIFELAIEDCSNYVPAVDGLVRALHQQGKTDEVDAVVNVWGRLLER